MHRAEVRRPTATPRVRRGRLVLASTSHHVAPVEIRERLASGETAQLEALIAAQCGPSVVLSTCNRLEVYCWTARPGAAATLLRLLSQQAGVPREALAPYVYTQTGEAAIRHLLRVAAGLDSLALGEAQILGQVRTAWRAAAARDSLPSEMHLVFSRTMEAARRIRTASHLGQHPSVAALAIDAAAQALGGLAGLSAAVLGAGATGKLALQTLAARGAAPLTLVNRSVEHARMVAASLPLAGAPTVAPLERLSDVLGSVDVLVCATASQRPVVTAALVEAALAQRAGQPLVIVDVAVPRDVEPAVRQLPGVALIDLDDLEARCAAGPDQRRSALLHADQMAHDAAAEIGAALKLREVAPAITAVRQQAEAVRLAALRRAAGKLRDLTPQERAAVDQLTYTIVQKLLHSPTIALRQSGAKRARRLALLEALVGTGHYLRTL